MNRLSRRDLLKKLGIGSVSLAVPRLLMGRDTGSGSSKPNIVFIMADDMGYGDAGCYNPDSKTPTPNIDRLAAQGVRFTDAHAPGAWCVPSRYGLLTGRYPFRIKFNLNHSLIERGRLTLGSLLKSSGYRTACVGKWHLGFEGGSKNRDFSKPMRDGPVDRGFDSFFGLHASLDIPPYYYIQDDRCVGAPTGDIKSSNSPGVTRIQGAFWRAGKIAAGFKHHEVLPKFAGKAVAFIEQHKKAGGDKPFFLYLALAAPHTPWVPTGRFRGSSKAGDYGDFVTQVDDTVAQVVKALDRLGLSKETLVFFTSDNGPVWYNADIKRYEHRSSGVLRGIKGDAWEGGHRMPFIARWPGRIKPGSVCDEMICFTDMMATFAAIVAHKLPAGAGEDSYNILPALLGRKLDRPIREALVIENRVIRQGDWKLIFGRPDGGISRLGSGRKKGPQPKGCLYNLKDDLAETTNLYDKHPEIVQRLTKLMAKYRKAGRSAPLGS